MQIKKIKKNNINIMYIPALVLFAIFVVYPFIMGIRYSFLNWNGYSQTSSFVGLENFKYLFKDPNLLLSFKNTLIYGFGSTLFQQILGLSYALLLNSYFRVRTIARTFIYLPVLIAAVIMGYMWYFLFQYNQGALNDVLGLFGLDKLDWLANGSRAVRLIVLVNTLQYCGISMIIYLAGLQSIPDIYFEAANIDGASAFAKFKHITLPLLIPAIVTSLTINLIGGLKLFDVIKALTNGGPGYATHSISTLITYSYFNSQKAGYASAMGIFLFALIMFVSVVLQKSLKSKEVEY